MQQDFAAAEREFRLAAQLHKDSTNTEWPDALVNLATAIRNQGRLEEAYFIYMDVLRIDPKNARAQRAIAEMRGPS
jgi:tetratricopeptide (TPR) repeat protein